ncbi:ArnT family glycosyltransferase [Sphingomonas parapaucimobilis]|uniref:ArnT family glycosyltransferase n=1 Tax=Sphingomonas parapaucimobilis TaxID=28213 RepID=UPI0035C85331
MPSFDRSTILNPNRLLILLAVALVARALTFGNPVVHVDEEFYFFTGHSMWQGAWPFVDVWDRKPVGLFLLYAIPAAFGFPAGIWAYQAMALASVVATAWLIARMAERLGCGAGAAAAGIAYVLWLDLLGGQGGQAPVFYNLLMIGAAWAILESDRRASRAQGLVAMALVGVVLQIKYSAVFEGMVFGLWLLASEWRRSRSPVALILYGAALVAVSLAPTALAAGVYAAIGQWDAFLYANFLSIFHRNPDPIGELAGNLGQMVLILSPIVTLAVLGLKRTERDSERTFLAVWLGAGVVGVLLFRPWFDHYGLPILLPACTAAAAMLGREDWRRRHTPALLLAVALAGQIVLLSLRHERGDAAEFAALSQAVGKEPGCLYVYSGSTMLYVATQRCTLSRWIVPAHLSRAREAGATGIDQDAEITRILSQHPAVVVMRPPYNGERPEAHVRVLAAMADGYRLAAKLPMGNETISVYKSAR